MARKIRKREDSQAARPHQVSTPVSARAHDFKEDQQRRGVSARSLVEAGLWLYQRLTPAQRDHARAAAYWWALGKDADADLEARALDELARPEQGQQPRSVKGSG